MQSIKSTPAAMPAAPSAVPAGGLTKAPAAQRQPGLAQPGLQRNLQQNLQQNIQQNFLRQGVMRSPFQQALADGRQLNRPSQTQPQNQLSANVNKTMQQMAKLNSQLNTPSVSIYENSPALSKKAPEYPEAAFERLNNMMESNRQTRDEASQKLQRQLSDMKEKFFENYSYKTETGEDGKPKLKMDEQGRPQLQQGKETFEQRVARQQHESAVSKSYAEYHNNVKESFLNNEKQQIMQYLQNHRNELSNPSIQQELQKMIAESEKKALKLKREIDSQMLELDLPTEDMRKFAKEEQKKLHDMEDKHKKMEDSSAEAHELIMYQEEMNAFAMEEKKKIQFAEKDEAFLKTPDELLKPPAPPTLAELLPPYLVSALYNIGIYAIE